MKRQRAVLLLIALLLPTTSYAQQPPPPVAECGSRIIERMGRTTEKWHAQADAIVRARTFGHSPFDEDEVFLTIEHDITVSEVFKAHNGLPPSGSSQRLLQVGFTAEKEVPGDARTSLASLPAGTDWILFLFWLEDEGAFMVPWEEEAVIEIRHGRLVTRGSTPIAESWRGKPVEELEAVLRAVAPIPGR